MDGVRKRNVQKSLRHRGDKHQRREGEIQERVAPTFRVQKGRRELGKSKNKRGGILLDTKRVNRGKRLRKKSKTKNHPSGINIPFTREDMEGTKNQVQTRQKAIKE